MKVFVFVFVFWSMCISVPRLPASSAQYLRCIRQKGNPMSSLLCCSLSSQSPASLTPSCHLLESSSICFTHNIEIHCIYNVEGEIGKHMSSPSSSKQKSLLNLFYSTSTLLKKRKKNRSYQTRIPLSSQLQSYEITCLCPQLLPHFSFYNKRDSPPGS